MLEQNHLTRPRAVMLANAFPLTKAETAICANKDALHARVSHSGLHMKEVEGFWLALAICRDYTQLSSPRHWCSTQVAKVVRLTLIHLTCYLRHGP